MTKLSGWLRYWAWKPKAFSGIPTVKVNDHDGSFLKGDMKRKFLLLPLKEQ